MQGNVTSGVYVVVTVFDRIQLEGAVAARDERIFESLGAGRAAAGLVGIVRHLDVIHLEIGREADLRSLQQGDVADAAYRHE